VWPGLQLAVAGKNPARNVGFCAHGRVKAAGLRSVLHYHKGLLRPARSGHYHPGSGIPALTMPTM